jgi:hypothetical protein
MRRRRSKKKRKREKRKQKRKKNPNQKASHLQNGSLLIQKRLLSQSLRRKLANQNLNEADTTHRHPRKPLSLDE